MQKNEGNMIKFKGENDTLEWEGSLIKMNGNCKVKELEVTGKEMGLKVKEPGDLTTYNCNSCEFTAIPLKIYDFYLYTKEVIRAEERDKEIINLKTVIPRDSREIIVETLPRPAAGSCGCETTCKIVPPKTKKTYDDFSWFSVSLAQAGVSPVPVPLCMKSIYLDSPQADGVPFLWDPRGTPNFCDERYSESWSDDEQLYYDYWVKLPVDVGNHEEGDEPSLCKTIWPSYAWLAQSEASPLL
jgi:hypothetical protein